jgi:hypothetical protein
MAGRSCKTIPGFASACDRGTGIKLYQSNSSPNSRQVRIFLAEKGITVTQVPVDAAIKKIL